MVPPPPTIIFERQSLTQQIIYHWKGNLTADRIHFNHWKNILISRFYELGNLRMVLIDQVAGEITVNNVCVLCEPEKAWINRLQTLRQNDN